jgi:hypothetical protein
MNEIHQVLFNDIFQYCKENNNLKCGKISFLSDNKLSIDIIHLRRNIFTIILTNTNAIFSIPVGMDIHYRLSTYAELTDTWIQDAVTSFPDAAKLFQIGNHV